MQSYSSSRLGTSLTELIVALALLASAVAGVGRFRSTTNEGLRTRELSARIGWELQNTRDRIESWQLADITVTNIEKLPFPETLATDLSSPRWQAQVTRINEPATALRVTLELHCTLHGQAAQPDALTFWIDASAENPVEPDNHE